MGEINLTPFIEEESFTSTGLSDRYAELGQQGIDDLTKVAFQDGCLNENHSPSFLSFSETVEFHADAVMTVAYTNGWSGAAQTGLSYWNATTASSPVVMNYPPNDGTWGPIEDGAGNDLAITLPAAVTLSDPQFNDRFGLDAVLVMMNVQVERFEFYEEDGTTPVVGPTPAGACGAAFVIQVSADNVTWYHLYLGDSDFTSGAASGVAPYRYRVTERRVEAWESEAKTTTYYAAGRGFTCRRDISIRTIINASSIFNCVSPVNSKNIITSFRHIRGAISIIKGAGGGGNNMHDQTVTAKIRKANLTVLALRANEVDPSA